MSRAPTTFRIALQDEAMEVLMEQSAAIGAPPREILSAIVHSVLMHARTTGMMVVEPSGGLPSTTQH